VSLFLVLFIRYGTIDQFLINAHLVPFSLVFVLWLAIFYIIGLYDIRTLKKGYELFEQLFLSIAIGLAVAIALFYSVPSFKITPKTSLALFALIFFVIESGWRTLFVRWSKTPQKYVLVIGSGKDVEDLEKFLFENPHVGYKVSFQIREPQNINSKLIEDVIVKNGITTILIDPKSVSADEIFDELYRHMASGIEIMNLSVAYEGILKKLPLSEVKDFGLVTEMSRSRKIYESIKKPIEMFTALILFIVLLPLMLLVYLLVKITSVGSGIYKQMRVGKNENSFVLYKFRTMRVNAEDLGPQWSSTIDERTTLVGRILRRTHLDELPQLINVIRGDLSFVGPRPERPEFVIKLKEKIPYFDIRHMVKPGITGWAQINFRYGSSVEDAMQKLQYDIFYIKNRSLGLDFLIILKTVKMFIFNYD
jgi:exopolysaccharide biosynthesis polyprenyl glycosylphosphotransferase